MKFKKFTKGKMRILLCLVCILLADPLLAVDGYKQFKFGTSLEEIKKTNICAWNDALAPKYQHRKTLFCEDFKFNGQATMGLFFFIDDKFLKLVINISYDQKESILAVLKKKYGAMSLDPSAEDIINFYNLPNQDIWYGFDKDTIYLGCSSNNSYIKSARLYYQSPLYKKLLDAKNAKSLKDDL